MLRVSLLYLPPPFRRGVRLEERGEIVRRGREGDLDRESRRDTSEYGERVRGRPRTGVRDLDREGMVVVVSLDGGRTRLLKLNARLWKFRSISGGARDEDACQVEQIVGWERNLTFTSSIEMRQEKQSMIPHFRVISGTLPSWFCWGKAYPSPLPSAWEYFEIYALEVLRFQ